MTFLISATLLASVLFSCSLKPSETVAKFPEDEQLIKIWQTFKEAVNKSDTITLLSISHSCILCSLCSSPQENHFMPVEEFYQKYFR
jgi:hypothetical protein